MKHFITLFSLLIALAVATGCANNQPTATTNATTPAEPTTLTIYTYESLAADYGLLPLITDQFEQQQNVKLDIVSFPDTGAMLNQLIAEKDHPKADIVLGLDNIDFAQVKKYDLAEAYQPQRANEIADRLWFDDAFTMTPFDYGYVDFVYDSQVLDFPEPINLSTLATDPAYKGKIIIEQPGLSSPGTQLLAWSQQALGDSGADSFWQAMQDQVLTVAPDWNTAYYSMFLNGEAPIVLSYVTSPAYHIDQEDTDRYKAIPIQEGYLEQVEGVAVVRGTDDAVDADAFIDYLLTNDVQNKIPTTQWMFPVFGDSAQWPAAYQQIIVPTSEQVLSLPPAAVANNYDTWLQQWDTTFGL